VAKWKKRRTALEIGGRILEDAAVRGTYYVSFGLAGKKTDVGVIGSLDDLAGPRIRGHELACHTFDHFDCEKVPSQRISQSLDHNQKVAIDLGLKPFRNFAYPCSHFSRSAKASAMLRYSSARTTIRRLNRGMIDLGLLRSIPLYSRFGREYLHSYFKELGVSGGWMMLYTHDVSEKPSAFGTTPEDLQ